MVQIVGLDSIEQLAKGGFGFGQGQDNGAVVHLHGQVGPFADARLFCDLSRNSDGETVAPLADVESHIRSVYGGYTFAARSIGLEAEAGQAEIIRDEHAVAARGVDPSGVSILTR